MTYYVDADECFSKKISFWFADEIDKTVNHRLMASMTVASDIHMGNLDDIFCVTEPYSIAYDMMLVFDENNPM